jgi:glycosyltransferase involved in cell wall biosynthesis
VTSKAAASDGQQARDFLFVQSTTEVGGAETVLLNLFDASPELRGRSIIANLGFGEGDVPRRLRQMGAEVVDLPHARLRHPVGTLRNVLALRSLARARSIRVVVGNGAHPQIIAGAVARLAGARGVFFVHMIHHYPLWKNDPLDAIAVCSPCDLLLANSKASLATLRQLRPNVESRLLQLGTPIRPVPEAEARGARAELGVPPDDLLIGVFGRLQRWKGQDVFVEAAVRVAAVRPGIRFVVVGGSVFGLEPEFLEGLRRRVTQAGLDGRVTFTGFRTDVPALMAACDLVCHTSRVPEPFGMVIIEAMALGRPVIASRGGGPSEIIEDGTSGLLVSPEDPEGLAREMLRLADDPAERRRLGARAAERVKNHFDIETTAAGLIRELDAVSRPR